MERISIQGLLTPRQHELISEWLGTGSINIFGLPFAGKDTHGHVLADLFTAPLLGGGDILRSITIPPKLQAQLDAGMLFPTDEYMKIVTPYLADEKFAGLPLILSSVGRWIGEEEGVLQATAASGHETKAVIYLHISKDVAYARLAQSKELGDRSHRGDDHAHVLTKRIEEFEIKTLPVIEKYRQKGLLIEINSDAEKHEVMESILARLFLIATENRS